MKNHTVGSLEIYQFNLWSGLNHAIFTRKGGVSEGAYASLNIGGTVGDDLESVRYNHKLMYDAVNVKPESTCTTWLVHGCDVLIVDGPVRGRRWIALADAMITNKPDTPLVMRFADCTPILFYDPVKHAIGIAHAGWRGTLAGVASNTVKAMVQAYRSNPADIQVGIGPAIGPDRYQVGEEVVAAVQQYFGTLNGNAAEGHLIKRDPVDGTAYFNLWSANRLDLERAGVKQIEVAGICTAENTHLFFSHRAEKGKTGRFGAIVSL